MEEQAIEIKGEALPDVIKNPFMASCITGVRISYSPEIFHPETWECYGWVEFKNGETKGEQSFRGETFDEVVVQIKACINNLISQSKTE